MPIHDWTRTYAGIFHSFHPSWCGRIQDRLNGGVLPEDYYALTEQVAVGIEGDVLTLQDRGDAPPDPTDTGGGAVLATAPKTRFVAVLGQFPPRKKNTVAVRDVSDDRVVAVIEIISPGNKESRSGFRAFLDKTVDLVAKGVHLLILDLFPPTPRDPHGIHAAILDEMTGETFVPPAGEPLTAVAYEADRPPRAYIEPLAVAAVLPDMPVFLKPGRCVMLPLEETYQSAYAAVPRRWRRVIDGEQPTG
jgi:hypothetical protein